MFRVSPRTLFDFEQEIGDLFDGFLRPGTRESEFIPALDIAEQDHESVLVAEIPGVKRDDIKITIQNDVLTLSAERRQAGLPEEARWIRNEIPAGRFSRSVSLPHPVDVDRVSAELKNGILRVTLPKAASARPKEIAIQ
jgi:HSP20 family protein